LRRTEAYAVILVYDDTGNVIEVHNRLRSPVSSACHAFLTIRNLTRNTQVSTLAHGYNQRTVRKTKGTGTTKGRLVLQFARDFFAGENHVQFAIEALVFGAQLALCAWPIIAAAGAISQVL
jgi:hypothetical protein